jgi:hypothetical protein
MRTATHRPVHPVVDDRTHDCAALAVAMAGLSAPSVRAIGPAPRVRDGVGLTTRLSSRVRRFGFGAGDFGLGTRETAVACGAGAFKAGLGWPNRWVK